MAIANLLSQSETRRFWQVWRSPAVRWYAGTFVADAVILVTLLLMYRLASLWLGVDGFSQYALARRVISFVQCVVFLGLDVALARQIAHCEGGGERNGRTAAGYLVAGSLIASAALTLFLVPANLGSSVVSIVLFGGPQYGNLVPALSMVLVGGAAHVIVYAFLRGRMMIAAANLLLVTNFSLVPLAAIVGFGSSAAEVLWWTGILTSGVSLAALALIARCSKWRVLRLQAHAWELFVYGLRRVPGTLAVAMLLAMPTVLAAHFAGLHEAGMVALASTVLTILMTAAAPISMVLLPQATKLLAAGQHHALRRHVVTILLYVVPVTAVAVVAGVVFAGPAVELLLGQAYSSSVPVARLMLLGAPPLVIYVCLRSVLDGAYHQAVNGRNAIVALLVGASAVAISRYWNGGLAPLLVASLGGFYVLGLLTCLETWRVLAGEQCERCERHLNNVITPCRPRVGGE